MDRPDGAWGIRTSQGSRQGRTRTQTQKTRGPGATEFSCFERTVGSTRLPAMELAPTGGGAHPSWPSQRRITPEPRIAPHLEPLRTRKCRRAGTIRLPWPELSTRTLRLWEAQPYRPPRFPPSTHKCLGAGTSRRDRGHKRISCTRLWLHRSHSRGTRKRHNGQAASVNHESTKHLAHTLRDDESWYAAPEERLREANLPSDALERGQKPITARGINAFAMTQIYILLTLTYTLVHN